MRTNCSDRESGRNFLVRIQLHGEKVAGEFLPASGKMSQNEYERTVKAQKIGMTVLGVWPMEKRTAFRIFRQCVATCIELCLVVMLIMEAMFKDDETGSMLEIILFIDCCTLAFVKNLIPTYHRKKLATIVRAGIDDYTQSDQKDFEFLKKRSRFAFIISHLQLSVGFLCTVVYVFSIVMQPPFVRYDPVRNRTIVKRFYVIPSSWMNFEPTEMQFAIITAFHTLECVVVSVRQVTYDTFFLSITLHLSTRFEMLKKEFLEFGQTKETVANYRAKLGKLVRKHCHLISLTDKVEECYNFVVLMQLVLSGVLIGLAGFGLIMTIRMGDRMEMLKNIFIMNFMFSQSVLYTYAGDMLLRESEDVFHAIYETIWYKLPPTITKDLAFIMMRTNIPVRLTGGKFFYVSRSTMMNILKTAGSYISVLQVAMLS